MGSLHLEEGTVIEGRYVVERRIGSGGMAEVYRVRHAHLGTLYALKVLTLGGRSLSERLMQEGRVQAALRHPNIVAVTDLVLVEGAPGLVMEYVQGPPLDALLGNQRLEPKQVDAVAWGILEGVQAAHRLNLIHRDLKPANVMMAIAGDTLIPKVADFGLVKLVADEDDGFASKTRSGMAMGTPAYMAPEQVRDAKSVDHRADVWSLGAILFELCAGRRAFNGVDVLELMVKVAGNQRASIRDVAPDIPDRMAAAIEGALTIDPDARIPSVRELRNVWSGGGGAPSAEVWGPTEIARARELSAGGEAAEDLIRRSFRSGEGPGLGHLPTAVPPPRANPDAQTGPARRLAEMETAWETFGDAHDVTLEPPEPNPAANATTLGGTIDPGAFEDDVDSLAAAGDMSLETLAPEPAEAPVEADPPVPIPSSGEPPPVALHAADTLPILSANDAASSPASAPGARIPVVLLGAGTLVAACALALALGIGFGVVGFGAGDGPEAPPEGGEALALSDAVSEPTLQAEPEAPADVDTPQATAAPGEAEAAPAAAPAPAPTHPSPDGVRAAQPAPAPAPAPTLQASTRPIPPAPTPAPEPESGAGAETLAATAGPQKPSVSIFSDVTVLLRDSGGQSADLRSITPGRYTIVAFFQARIPTEVEAVDLAPGQHLEIRCYKAHARCTTK